MPTFRKRVIGPGVYQTPDGPARVTPARIQHWHDSIQGMLREGYKPPVSWGHHSRAKPATEDDSAYWSSKFNAGKVTASEIDPKTGELILTADAPGVELDAGGALVTQAELPDGTKVRTAIEEVSIGSLDWTDGKGRVWKDAPVHLALTPLPVWVPPGGQPPFEPGKPAGQHFSTRALLYRFASEASMADDYEKPAEGAADAAPEPAEEKPTIDFTADGGDTKRVQEVITLLAEAGVQLPSDTNAENLLERLCIALNVLKGNKPEPAPEPTPAPEEPVTEEAPGAQTFMSTIKDPYVKALLADREESDQRRRLERITALTKRGLRGNIAKELREQASKTRFSLGADGRPAKAEVDTMLDLLEKQMPEGTFEQTYLSTLLAGATEEEAPEASQNGRERWKKIADEQAKNSRLPARK